VRFLLTPPTTPLSSRSFDVCKTCYSPPIVVNVPRGSLSLNVTAGVSIVFRFSNNGRNVQLKLPMPATVYW
jgi:hypothetical protein